MGCTCQQKFGPLKVFEMTPGEQNYLPDGSRVETMILSSDTADLTLSLGDTSFTLGVAEQPMTIRKPGLLPDTLSLASSDGSGKLRIFYREAVPSC